MHDTPSNDRRLDRRQVLRGAGAAGAVVLGGLTLSACSSGGGGASGGATSGSGGGSAGAGARVVTPTSDVPVGGSAVLQADGQSYAVAQPTAGHFVCHSALCTHQGCVVAADGGQLVCPCHGSVFDAATGKVLQGPAQQPLPEITVTVKGNDVVTT